MPDTFEDLDPQEMYELLSDERKYEIDMKFSDDVSNERDDAREIFFAVKDRKDMTIELWNDLLEQRWKLHLEYLFRPLKSDWQAALTAYKERQLQLAEDAHEQADV